MKKAAINHRQMRGTTALSVVICLCLARGPVAAQSYIGVPSGFSGPGPWATSVVATTNMGAGLGSKISHVVDGSGLSSASLTAVAAVSTPSNAWLSSNGDLSGEVTINLGQSYVVDTLSMWNFSDGPGGQPRGSAGIQDLVVEYSTDGVNYTPLPGGPTQFDQVTGTAVTNAPQVVDFAPVTANYFLLLIASNWGNTSNTGFDEIGFGSVPEPGILAICSALVVPGLGVLIRRTTALRKL